MTKNIAVPIREALVETVSSLGTGMKAKMSIFFRRRMAMLGCDSEMKDYDFCRGLCILMLSMILIFVVKAGTFFNQSYLIEYFMY